MSQDHTSLMIVDDDPGLRDALAAYLRGFGFEVRAVSNAAAMDAALAQRAADLVILDIMMPGEDGLSACRRLVARGVRLLLLSALDGVTDRIVGLEAGACDYLGKPFDPRELLARVRAQLRQDEATTRARQLESGIWRLDLDARTVTAAALGTVALSTSEFELLRMFLRSSGRVLSREHIISHCHGHGADILDRAIDLQISRLRRKLGDARGATLQTVRGAGYRWAASVRAC